MREASGGPWRLGSGVSVFALGKPRSCRAWPSSVLVGVTRAPQPSPVSPGLRGAVAYCCKSSGSGKDFVRICDEMDQVIDLEIGVPTTTTTLPRRILGYPRYLLRY